MITAAWLRQANRDLTTNFHVGQVVEYRPPVSGGVAIAVITKVINRNNVALRVTDGTALYPTGSFPTTSTSWIQ